jgi:Kelch motif
MTAVFVAAVLAMGFTSFLLVAPLRPAHAEAIGSWVQTTSYPSKTQDPSCVTSGGYIYCVGGVVSPSGTPQDSVYYAPLSSSGIGAWTQTTSYPIAVYSLSCVTSESYIYCIGGSNGSAIATDVYYAPLSSSVVGTWQSTAAYPTPIDGESCVATHQSYVYCVGGSLSSSTGGSANVYYAPLSSSGVGTWMGATSYPVPVWFESCVYVPGQTGGFIHCMGDESMQVPSNSVYSAPVSASGGLLGAWSLAGTCQPATLASPASWGRRR